MHLLAQLRHVEEALATPRLAVVGVHAGKFPYERKTPAIAQAVARLGIAHPVVNDAHLEVWDAYAVRAWPTLVFLDAQGRVLGRHEGEVDAQALMAFLRPLLDALADTEEPPPLPRTPMEPPPGLLRFPGFVALAPQGDAWYVSDTGHHRVLEVDAQGKVLRVFGTGEPGLVDGPPHQARFAEPQGLWVGEGEILVADRANHAVRRIVRKSGQVVTLWGSGRRGGVASPGTVPSSLASPWGLAWWRGAWWVAMAGVHQLWAFSPDGRLAEVVGSGYEGLHDGRWARARFAQPTALAPWEDRLYVVDSESSSVRVLEEGQVRTLVGEGLFVFGDADGKAPQARLMHPQGVAVGPSGELYVADTYNGKVRRLDPITGEVATVMKGLHEPQGLWVQDGKLYVAESGAHRILIRPLGDTGQGKTWPSDDQLPLGDPCSHG